MPALNSFGGNNASTISNYHLCIGRQLGRAISWETTMKTIYFSLVIAGAVAFMAGYEVLMLFARAVDALHFPN
jgi:hypothetical protein